MTMPLSMTFRETRSYWRQYADDVRADYPALAAQVEAILEAKRGLHVTLTIHRGAEGVRSATEGKPR